MFNPYHDRKQCNCKNYAQFSFYDDYGGSDEKVNNAGSSEIPQIVMTFDEGCKYTAVPKKEMQKLIDNNKINYIKSNMGILVHYQDMKSVKYWWKKYQEEKRGEKA